MLFRPSISSPWKIHDAGASAAGFADEANDCAVRAFAVAFKIRYLDSFQLLQRLGRRPGRGTHVSEVVHAAAEACGFRAQQLYCHQRRGRSCRVGDLLEMRDPRLVLLVTTRDHVFCVRDRQIHDLLAVPLSRKIEEMWMVQPMSWKDRFARTALGRIFQ